MNNLEEFKLWLKTNKPDLAKSTIDKYVRAVKITSKEMLEYNVIKKALHL